MLSILKTALINLPILVKVSGKELKLSIKQGLIKTTLGKQNQFPENLSVKNNDYYLGVTIADDQELIPRKRLSANPFSVSASYAEEAKNAQTLQGKKIGKSKGDILVLDNNGEIDNNLLSNNISKLGNDIDISEETNLAVNGKLLSLSGDTLSINEGTLTDGRICTYSQTEGLVCNTTTDSVIDVETEGITTTTYSNSGLETTTAGLRLLGGCQNGQVLAWNSSEAQWQCTDTTAGNSTWTDLASLTYLTSTTNDFIIGGTTLTNSSFGVDVSNNQYFLGYNSSADPSLLFQASNSETATLGFNQNDAFYFQGGNVGIGTTAPLAGLIIGSATYSYANSADDVGVKGSLEVLNTLYANEVQATSLPLLALVEKTLLLTLL